MKRIAFVFSTILMCLFIVGCFSRIELNRRFDAYEIEVSEKPAYVYYDTLVIEGATVDFREMLSNTNYSGIFHEVYVIENATIWFGFSHKDGDLLKWNIASMDVGSSEFNVRYSGEFGSEIDADKHYKQYNNNNSNEGYLTDNGYYYDGRIVLTDGVKTVEFDLETNQTKEFSATDYRHPSMTIQAEITDPHTISFLKGTEHKVFNVEQGKQTGKVFEKLCELENEKNWEGKSYLSKLFDKVQILDNQAYILCSVLNWDGETHALVFEYDFETNSCKYAFHHFMNDIILNDLYMVPRI